MSATMDEWAFWIALLAFAIALAGLVRAIR
jgi:hypothetical protein